MLSRPSGHFLVWTFVCSMAACTAERGTADTPTPVKVTPEAAPAKAEPAAAPPPAPAPTPGEAQPQKAAPLTAEEIRLIEADPKDLTPDERRQRGYALRKKIMQNPNSPSAQALEDIRKSVEAGELVPPNFNKDEKQDGLWIEAPGGGKTPPAGGSPPAGARPDDGTMK